MLPTAANIIIIYEIHYNKIQYTQFRKHLRKSSSVIKQVHLIIIRILSTLTLVRSPNCLESAVSETQCLHLVYTLGRHSSFLHGGGGERIILLLRIFAMAYYLSGRISKAVSFKASGNTRSYRAVDCVPVEDALAPAVMSLLHQADDVPLLNKQNM
jgi:hypothetical protein